MALWHGLELPLALSAAGWVVGAALFYAQRARERRTEIARPGGEPGAVYRATARGVDEIADGVTSATQRGSLPVSLGAILLVLVAFPGLMLIRADTGPKDVTLLGEPAQLVLSLVILGIAAATVRVKRGLTAVLMVGGVGYAIAVLFILRGAPDLALTQILVETVTLIAALLVLTRLPDDALYTTHKGNGFRAAIAIAVRRPDDGARADHSRHPDGHPGLGGPGRAGRRVRRRQEHRQRHPGGRPGLGHLRRDHRADRRRHRRRVADLPGPAHRPRPAATDGGARTRSVRGSRRRGWPPTGCRAGRCCSRSSPG